MGVLILTGPPGVGKTTVARLLIKRAEPGVHLEADRFFFFIRSGFVEPWDPQSAQQNQVVMRAVAEAGASYATAGYTTIIDGIVIPRWTLGVVRETLQAAGLEAEYAVLRAPRSVCIARFQEREGSPDLLDPRIVSAIGSEFDDLGEFERHAVDADAMSSEQVADAIERASGEGVLRLEHG